MEISFKIKGFKGPEEALSREWIETDHSGNYASSTILGLNTRKRHGLFVHSDKKTGDFLVLLSHLQEDYYDGKKQYPLFNSEYEEKTVLEGFKNQVGFQLDPLPTFIYQCQGLTIRKSVFLVPGQNRLIIRYKTEGEPDRHSRLVIRPFFAFRPPDKTTPTSLFVNQNVFEMENQFRFLPFPDVPEIFMYYSAGKFIDASMWYHSFFYRNDGSDEERSEDLLNPGFFEVSLAESNEVYLSLGFSETNMKELINFHQEETDRRIFALDRHPAANETVRYLFGKMDEFCIKQQADKRLIVSRLPGKSVNFSVNCFIGRRILRSGIEKDIAKEYYHTIRNLISDNTLLEILKGNSSEITADVASAFSLVFFLYEYHSKFDRQTFLEDSFKIVQEIITHVQKNHLPYFKRRRSKLLERRYDSFPKIKPQEHEVYYPDRQNFIINVFWYNILKMAEKLAAYNNVRPGKYEKLAKKVEKRFNEQYVKPFADEPEKAYKTYAFAFHPGMIYAIALPFQIMNRENARKLYTILLKQFMDSDGIKFPLNRKGKSDFVISPLLLGDYFDAWNLLMAEKKSFIKLFQQLERTLSRNLSHGILGFLPDNISRAAAGRYGASALATCEAMYFISRLQETMEQEK